jgi:hypothetical protein
MANLIERHREKIVGILSCFDRLVLQGTLPSVAYPQAVATELDRRDIRLFDYAKQFALPFREAIRARTEQLADEEGVEIEYIQRMKTFRKEDRIQQILAVRGNRPGLVHIFSAMEPGPTYEPWHDKKTGCTFIRRDRGKCLHYYFYFIDEMLGLCFLSVPTWCPFRTLFYLNGHNWLASKLRSANISYELQDNAFAAIDDWDKAQQLSDRLMVKQLHTRLDAAVARYLPDLESLGRYHWSILQAEYATDIVFRSAEDLAPLYDHLLRTAIHAVKVDDVATFLGHSPHRIGERETGGDFSIRRHGLRLEGTRIRHYLGPASIKMYDKHGFILRVETTTNDVTFFRHHRMVEQRDGQRVFKLAALRKSIYSLSPDLASISRAANDRYIQFLSSIDDPTPGVKALSKISESVEEREHRYRGFNLFDDEDQTLFEVLCRGEFLIHGFRNRSLRQHLKQFRPSQISRLLKRLRLHGIIKKVGNTYKYYLTQLGRHVAIAGLTLKNMFLVPEFARAAIAY